MTYEKLIKDIERIQYMLNESNDSKFLVRIKNKIRDFLKSSPKNELINNIKKIIKYINNGFKNHKPFLLGFIASFLLSTSFFNINANELKDIYASEGVYELVNWNKYEEKQITINNINYIFGTGEYYLDRELEKKIFKEIESNIEKDSVYTISGNAIVSISIEDNKYSNYANDDTQIEKEEGGKLLFKRKEVVEDLFKRINKLLKIRGYNVNLNINIIAKEGLGKIFKLNNISIVNKQSDLIKVRSNNNTYGKNDNISNTDSNIIIPNGKGFSKDITKLSKNYQYVELLKLGGIETERVQGDNRKNLYADWIINTRKNPKRMLSRLQRQYPEYDIRFKKSATSINPIKGAMKGMSNMGNQYQEIGEKNILDFNSFLNENIEVNNENIKRTWENILGDKFPNLTEEQAVEFDQNIEQVLDYLEQMYGQSAIEFSYVN